MRVSNIINNNGNTVANQFVIRDRNNLTFQSYTSIIFIFDYDAQTITFGRNWDYSRTTMKHLQTALNEIGITRQNSKSIYKSINSGLIDCFKCVYDEDLR
jgi:ArsR family metal-binding transcriptional regulator